MKSKPLAVGKRVLLRLPTKGDEAEYLALKRASWPFLKPWMVRLPRGFLPADPREFAGMRLANRGDRNLKTLVCRREDGAILGVVNFNEIVRGVFHSAYLGYWIGAPFARQGYMGEGLPLALRHAFGPLGLHRVEANIMPRNRASIALVRGAGFRREGLSPRYLRIAGRWEDHERWALLADERPRVSGGGRAARGGRRKRGGGSARRRGRIRR